ncbi:MAG TPA: hypothetical protein VGB73_08705, partial [Pyrinomonadaceae bacterium]
MKQCPTCQEVFADKFGFCPVDGTPLNGHVAATAAAQSLPPRAEYASAVNEPPVSEVTEVTATATDYEEETRASHPSGNGDGAAASAAASAAAAGRGEYHLTMLTDEGLTSRLTKELREVAHQSQLTWPEFKRDPLGFSKRTASAYSSLTWRFFSQRNVAIATLTAFVLIFSLVGTIIALERFRAERTASVAADEEQLELVQMLDTEIPKEEEKPDPGTAGMNKGKGGGSKPKQDKPQ